MSEGSPPIHFQAYQSSTVDREGPSLVSLHSSSFLSTHLSVSSSIDSSEMRWETKRRDSAWGREKGQECEVTRWKEWPVSSLTLPSLWVGLVHCIDGGDEGRREEWYGESEWERTVSSSLPSSLPHLYLRSSPSIPSIIHTFPYHISSKPSILETEEIVREEGGNGGNGRERSGNRWMRFLLFAFIVSFLSPHFARLSSPFHLLRLVGRGGMVRERRW